MIDLKLLRDNPEVIREALKRRGSSVDLEALLALEKQRRSPLTTIVQKRHELKAGSESFARQ